MLRGIAQFVKFGDDMFYSFRQGAGDGEDEDFDESEHEHFDHGTSAGVEGDGEAGEAGIEEYTSEDEDEDNNDDDSSGNNNNKRRSEVPLGESVHIDDTKTMYLVARGGAAGTGNKSVMRSTGGGGAGGGTKQKLQSMVSCECANNIL